MRSIGESTFVIATSGFADGPAQALRDYLVARDARAVTFVAHPLEQGPRERDGHVVSVYRSGTLTAERTLRVPNRPPYTYPLDLVVPLRIPVCDAWFGFNNLACAAGLARRRLGRAGKVVYWAVDFVPLRFGRGVLTRIYDRMDRLACTRADARIEVSSAALAGRAHRLRLDAAAAPASVVPMGAWLDRTPTVPEDARQRRKVVYLGHLVERQGVAGLLQALAILAARGLDVTADIVGSGPLEERLRQQSASLGLGSRVVFHGFVRDHGEVERILASASLAVAPYVVAEDNFTRYADPGKLKAYVAAGLPVVLTAVPPNAREIVDAGAGRIVEDTPEALADGIASLLDDDGSWRTSRRAALAYAERFDWPRILAGALGELGIGEAE